MQRVKEKQNMVCVQKNTKIILIQFGMVIGDIQMFIQC